MSYNQFRSDKAKIEYENYLEKCEDRWSVESNNYYVSTSFGKLLFVNMEMVSRLFYFHER